MLVGDAATKYSMEELKPSVIPDQKFTSGRRNQGMWLAIY